MTKIKAPHYCKDAVITARGWKHPKTNELLAARQFSAKDIADYNGQLTPEVEAPKPTLVEEILATPAEVVPEPVVEPEEVITADIKPEETPEPEVKPVAKKTKRKKTTKAGKTAK